MKVRQLLCENVQYSFDNRADGMKQLFDTLMMSPIKVVAKYTDYPSIDEEAEEAYDEFFRQFQAKGSASGRYVMSLDDTEHLKKLIDAASNFFNDPEDSGGDDMPWSFTFTVTA